MRLRDMTHERLPFDPILLERYLAGDASPAERADVEAGLNEAQAHELASLSVAIREASQGTTDDWHRAERWKHVAAALQAPSPSKRNIPRTPVHAAPRPILAYAVACAAVLGVAVFAIIKVRQPAGTTTPHTYTTQPSQRSTITLSDGTRVTLNAATSLSVARDFGKTHRTLHLNGEALFHVTSNTRTPFIVRSGAAQITVLGTEFTVRRYVGDSSVRVAVASGRVSLQKVVLRDSSQAPSDTRSEAILGARTVGELTEGGKTVVTPEADIGRELAWTQGKLIFQATPFLQAMRDLERHYNITIRVNAPALQREYITASFQTETVTEMLDLLALTFNVRYVRQDRTVTFLPTHASSTPVRRAPSFIPETRYGK